jgi:hypothetical protein
MAKVRRECKPSLLTKGGSGNKAVLDMTVNSEGKAVLDGQDEK